MLMGGLQRGMQPTLLQHGPGGDQVEAQVGRFLAHVAKAMPGLVKALDVANGGEEIVRALQEHLGLLSRPRAVHIARFWAAWGHDTWDLAMAGRGAVAGLAHLFSCSEEEAARDAAPLLEQARAFLLSVPRTESREWLCSIGVYESLQLVQHQMDELNKAAGGRWRPPYVPRPSRFTWKRPRARSTK